MVVWLLSCRNPGVNCYSLAEVSAEQYKYVGPGPIMLLCGLMGSIGQTGAGARSDDEVPQN